MCGSTFARGIIKKMSAEISVGYTLPLHKNKNLSLAQNYKVFKWCHRRCYPDNGQVWYDRLALPVVAQNVAGWPSAGTVPFLCCCACRRNHGEVYLACTTVGEESYRRHHRTTPNCEPIFETLLKGCIDSREILIFIAAKDLHCVVIVSESCFLCMAIKQCSSCEKLYPRLAYTTARHACCCCYWCLLFVAHLLIAVVYE